MDKYFCPLPKESMTKITNLVGTVLAKGESASLVFWPHAGAKKLFKFFLANQKLFPQIFAKNRQNFFLDFVDLPENSPKGYFYRLAQLLKIPLLPYSQIEEYSLFEKIQKQVETLIKSEQEIVVIWDNFNGLPQDLNFFNKLKAIWQIEKFKIHYLFLFKKTPEIKEAVTFGELFEVIFQNILIFPLPSGEEIDYIIEKLMAPEKPSSEFKRELKDLCGGHPFLLKIACRVRDKNKILDDMEIQIILNDFYQFGYREPFCQLYRNFLEKNKQDVSGGVIKIDESQNIFLSDQPAYYFLTPKEYEILRYFMQNQSKLISRDNLAGVLWGEEVFEHYSDWAIDQLISSLRQKLIKFNFSPALLKTIRGKGYVFNLV